MRQVESGGVQTETDVVQMDYSRGGQSPAHGPHPAC